MLFRSSSTSKKSKLTASGNLTIGFSGGLGSTVLLDIIHQCYFRHKAEIKGGKSHPRNERIWQKAFVCYVDSHNAFPEVCFELSNYLACIHI